MLRREAVGGYVPSFAERLEAAKAAAPFYAPKLSAVEATVVSKSFDEMTDEELIAVAAGQGLNGTAPQ